MNPKDDPEARIRELERPLAEQARTSELGAVPYDAYPPPPPMYGSVPPMPQPFHAGYPTASPRHGSRVMWVFGGVVMLIVTLVVIMVVATIAGVFSDVRDAIETADDNGSGTVVIEDGDSGVIIPPIPTFPSGASDTEVAQAGATVSIGGAYSTRTVVCEGGSVSVSGVENNVEITGSCAAVSVSGVDNVVTIELTDAISASGVGNQISYESGSPQVSQSGSDNVITMG